MADEIAPEPVSAPAEPQQAALPTEQIKSLAADDVEQSGLPLGSAQSADDVLAALVEHQTAFYDSLEADDTNPIEPAAPSAEVEQLRQQLAERDQQIAAMQQQIERQLREAEQQVEHRLTRAIDALASAKYGVGRNRNWKQVEASAAFRQKVLRFAEGLHLGGHPVPVLEELVAQVRRLDDETYTQPKPVDRTPLGTPGTNRDAKGGGEQPRTIHHALAQNPN